MRLHFQIVSIAILLLFTNLSYGQNIKVNNLNNSNNQNSFNVHLATTKLCKEFYDTKDLNEERQKKSGYSGQGDASGYGCHVCAESITMPYMNKLETFAHRYMNDKRIIKNRRNTFTLQSIRKELETKYREEFNKLVDSVDTENMIFYQSDLIQGYHIDSSKIYISMQPPSFKNLLANTHFNSYLFKTAVLKDFGLTEDGRAKNMYIKRLGEFRIPMSEEKAREVYGIYAEEYRPNPPFTIATKITYAMRLSEELNGMPRYYQIVLKKAEFFVPDKDNIKNIRLKVVDEVYTEDNKIAEVNFEDKIYYSGKDVPYQNVVSVE